MILGGEANFGFAGDIRKHANIDKTIIHREKLLVVSSPHHYLKKLKHCGVKELIEVPFVWREKGTLT